MRGAVTRCILPEANDGVTNASQISKVQLFSILAQAAYALPKMHVLFYPKDIPPE